MDVDRGREQAVPAHPALTAFVHPFMADAEASLEMTKRISILVPALYLATKHVSSYNIHQYIHREGGEHDTQPGLFD